MQYEDALYGRVEINEPLLSDLIASEAVQRLKGVSQHGITALIGITPAFSRFAHSMGAMILVRRLGAPMEEQVAALIHDVSHTAFSHVIDYVFDDHSGQSYHEERMEEFVSKSDIPALLARHGWDWRAFLDETRFPLLEQPAPALCADRLDYFFRDLEFLALATTSEVQAAINSLQVKHGKIVVSSAEIARWLAYTFIEADRASWSNFREVGIYQVTAEAIKAASECGLIEESDLWGTDESFWNKLRLSGQPEVRKWIELITPGTHFTWNDKDPVFRVTTKVRSIDPPVVCGDSVKALSELDPVFAEYRRCYLASKQGLWPMGIVTAPNAANGKPQSRDAAEWR